jgi:diadenosine tetraphosphate (Ap4A) HIT family hydrolase
MSYNPSNIFARILRGEIPCKEILKDTTFLAFYDITPKAPIHALVIPTGAYSDAYDFHKNASDQEVIGFYRGVAQVIDRLGLYDSGFRQISNCGINGGQEVPHYHVHLLGGSKLGAMIGE